jgi:hypothetical protein
MNTLRSRSFLACGAILATVLIGQSLLPGAPAPIRPAVPGEKIERRVFHLKRLSPTGAAETVRKLLDNEPGRKGTVKLVPWRPGRLVVYASLENLLRVTAILQPLDIAPPAPQRFIALQIRLFQVIDGWECPGTSAFPDDLGELKSELRTRGIRKPRVAAALSLDTRANEPFQGEKSSCLPDHSLTVSGRTINTKEQMVLRLNVDSLHTCVPIASDRPVVLGLVPLGKVSSVLAVQVKRTYEEKSPEKRFTFEFHNRPWSEVFVWLTEQTGKPFICTFKPTGSCTFVGPKGKTYTLSEVIDIISGQLMAKVQPYELINRGASFTLVPADEKIDLSIVPWSRVEDLHNRGRTEYVYVPVSLRSERAADLAEPLRKRLSQIGDLILPPACNELILCDRVGNLRGLCAAIRYLDQSSR